MFVASDFEDYPLWKFIKGKPQEGFSIKFQRYYHLLLLNSYHKLQIAFRDPYTNHWSKWRYISQIPMEDLANGYDIHRTLLPNEILIESDYPTYKENLKAITFIGRILEAKGFKPHYYHSGNKSIHCHIFVDTHTLKNIGKDLQDKLKFYYDTYPDFLQDFIVFLREKIITCFGANTYEFDKDLINPKHLIRSEMSLNKKGFKTYLGDSYVLLPKEPTYCNLDTAEYPELEYPVLSPIKEPSYLIMEFLMNKEIEFKAKKAKRYTRVEYEPDKIREGVEFLLSPDFMKLEDYRKRALFIITNELKSVYGTEVAYDILCNWNIQLDNYFSDNDLKYRVFEQKTYPLTSKYINDFVKEVKNGS